MDRITLLHEVVHKSMLLLLADGAGEHEKNALLKNFAKYVAECQRSIDDCDIAITECDEKIVEIRQNMSRHEVEIANQTEQIKLRKEAIEFKLAQLLEVKENLFDIL